MSWMGGPPGFLPGRKTLWWPGSYVPSILSSEQASLLGLWVGSMLILQLPQKRAGTLAVGFSTHRRLISLLFQVI